MKQPILTSNRPVTNFPATILLAVMAMLLCQPVVLAQTFTWDGGGGDDNFGTGANWVGDSSPSVGSGVRLDFTGSTRLTPNNNYTTGDDFGEWHLLSGAGGDFTISGNGFGLHNKVENDSGSGRAFTINTAGIFARDGSIELNPVGGNLIVGGSIELDNNASVNVYDGSNARTLTLNGALSNGNGTGGNGSLVLNQTATVILAADSDFGGTTINSGTTLRVGAGGGTGTLGVGNTLNNGSLIFNRTGSLSYGGIISGTGTLTKRGAGTLTLNGSAVNTYSGTTTVSAGTLVEDFSNIGATANLINSASALSLGGGTLQISGNGSSASSQTFASTTFTPGASVISAAPVSGANYPTVALGALTFQLGGTVRFEGPATINGAGNVAATATITTTTAGQGGAALPWGLINGGSPNGSTGIPYVGCYATVGLYDYASTDTAAGGAGTSPYTIIGGSQVTGFYTTTAPSGSSSVGNWNMTANTSLATGEKRGNSMRFNTASAPTLTLASGNLMTLGGILVTPNMGAVNASVTGAGSWQIWRQTTPTGWQEGVIWQNNVSGYLNFSAVISNGRDSGDNNYLVKVGDGTAVFSGVNSYVGQTYINGGNLVITANSGVGAPATAAAVNLNGGTLFGNATVTLDNTGANQRPITLLGNGGGLAASAGNTMTVSGIVSGAAGTGPLVVGIPASSANGNVAGQLPGSGSGTANTTPVNATGTVTLTGANSYTGGTILQSGTVNINGINALGGANYGGLTFNGGTLQYATTLTSGSDLSTGNGISLSSGGGTIDVNGNSVALANSIGKSGSGTLTVKSTAVNGILNLQNANTYTGGTTISSGTLRANNTSGSATGSGNVTVASGGTLGGGNTARTTGFISGLVTVNSGGILAPGSSVGTLTVGSLTLSSGSINNYEFNANPTNDQVVVTTSGGLTINGGAFNLYTEGGVTPWTTLGTYNLIHSCPTGLKDLWCKKRVGLRA